MKRLLQICLLLISLLTTTGAQGLLPEEGSNMRYRAYIEMPKGYVSGICILQHEGNEIRGCLFNEFGITALDFTYNIDKRKIRLGNVMNMLDKWYIRRILKKDLRGLMDKLKEGQTQYETKGRRYVLMPMEQTINN